MVTQNAAIELATDLAKEVKGMGLHLRRAILYGSYAKNEAHELSDIDIALVADEFIGVGYFDIGLFVSALRNKIMVHPKTYPSDYFEQGDPFIDEIMKTGIEIEF